METSGAGPTPRIAVSPTSTNSAEEDHQTPRDGQPMLEPLDRPENNRKWTPPPWHFGTNTKSWKRRGRSDVEWRMNWKECFANGRVLIIDYISNHANVVSGSGKPAAAVVQEFDNLKSLERFYADEKRVHAAALRIIHVQNAATWATDFLLRKYNVDHDNEMVGMPGFSKWTKYNGPMQRNGKPFPHGKSWRQQRDPWRSVSRTAFGLDYLKVFQTPEPNRRRLQNVFGDKPIDAHMMHLNTYDDDSRSPHGYDVSVQRISVYVQRNLGPPGKISPEDQGRNPYATFSSDGGHRNAKWDKKKVDLEQLDNSSTVIVFETSASLLMEDCLIQPRNELENRWRRLDLRREDKRDDQRLAASATNAILSDVFHGLAIVWQGFLAIAANHVNILEDKIYENPADESRAPELWTNQAAWLKVDKVMFLHRDILAEIQSHLRDVAAAETGDEVQPDLGQIEWLSSTPAEYERLAHGVQEDLVQPTMNLSDLMYKSVGIRDSRHSLQLGLSMWRLSWLTFVFLPATFMVSFFGMNVNVFGGEDGSAYPDIGWYFLGAALLMIVVLFLWYFIKHSFERARQTPYQRGLYEDMFASLEDEYPQMWTRDGALDNVEPDGFVSRTKWRFLRRWFAPEKTIDKRVYQSLGPNGDDSELSSWARCKSYLLRRWLPEIRLRQRIDDEGPMNRIAEEGLSTSAPASLRYEPSTIIELAKISTPIAMADAEPLAVQQLSTMGLQPLTVPDDGKRRKSSASSLGEGRHSEERPSSRGSSQIMFEEKNLSDSESDAGAGASKTKE